MDDIERNDLWVALKQFTPARIAMGRTGHSITMNDALAFKLAHAHARDAVYSSLNERDLQEHLAVFNLPILQVHSRVTYREQYLQRPDLGRRLDEHSVKLLTNDNACYDVAIIVADGLSAIAINENATSYLSHLIPLIKQANLTIAPVCIAHQARVAIADEIGQLLKANLSIILIGERPGLSAADSMGMYVTYKPAVGLTDESRNCISNIRQGGLSYKEAARKTFYLLTQALNNKLTGVELKDDYEQAIAPTNPYNEISP